MGSDGVKVAVIAGGPSEEHGVSVLSGAMVCRALADHPRYRPTLWVIEPDGRWHQQAPDTPATYSAKAPAGRWNRAAMAAGVQQLVDFDLAFLALHGRFGEDGTIQGLLEALGMPYSGSRPLASALAMDKRRAKQWFGLHGLPVAHEYRSAAEIRAYPVVVKPNTGGSSVGVHLVRTVEELEEALQEAGPEVLIEECVAGREVTCAVLQQVDGNLEALPVVEIIPRRGPFFDFASKYEDGGADEICPAPLDPAEASAIQELAIRAHQALGCRHFSRTDMILTAQGPVILETNTIPGMTPNSLLPKAAQAAGLSFSSLVEHLLRLVEQEVAPTSL
jgi:D-alanine-D-alanine ligase